MARRLRLEIPGGVYHVTNRGVDRADIVRDDDDRREWFRLFHRVAVRCGWQVFAHVLMTNHFHVFLKIPEANLSSGFHDVTGGYATLFNKRHSRTGTLFQGRFHAVLVESEGHAWSLSRYVHLNPCRAGLARKPEDYRWSTYRHFMDPQDAPSWLAWRTVFCEFGGSESAARIAYRRYVEAGLTEQISNPLATAFEGVLYGSETFINGHKHLLEEAEAEIAERSRATTLTRVLSMVAESFHVPEPTLRQPGRHGNWARDAAIWLTRQEARIPLNEIAAAFGRITASAVTDTVRRCEARQQQHPEYRTLCEFVRRKLYE